MSVHTDPPGALVLLDGKEVGRSPIQGHVVWEGKYDLEIRLAGYKPVKTTANFLPWWTWLPPWCYFREMFKSKDDDDLYYTLEPAGT